VTLTAAFLRVNGYRLAFSDREAYSFLAGLYESGRLRFDELERGFASTRHRQATRLNLFEQVYPRDVPGIMKAHQREPSSSARLDDTW
jgi:hypothetical protein